MTATMTENVHPDLQVGGRGKQMSPAWAFETSKPQFLILLRQFHQLGTSIQTYESTGGGALFSFKPPCPVSTSLLGLVYPLGSLSHYQEELTYWSWINNIESIVQMFSPVRIGFALSPLRSKFQRSALWEQFFSFTLSMDRFSFCIISPRKAKWT